MSAAGPPLWLRARRALGRLRRHFAIDTFDVFARPVADEPVGAPDGYVLRFGEPADLEGCDPWHTDLDERERRSGVARLGFGHQVVVALADDVVVFSMWVNPRNINIPGSLKRRLAPHQSFIYKAFTSPDHRGRRLYEAGMRFVLAAMAREGKRELIGYAHLKKKISRKGLAALKFRSVGRFTTVDWPGWRHTFVSRELGTYFPEELERSSILSTANATPTRP